MKRDGENGLKNDYSDGYIFEEAPVMKSIEVLAVPTVITQLINIVYNYADTWFV